MECTYVKDSAEPCENCPRKMTCYYMCDFLKETKEMLKDNGNKN